MLQNIYTILQKRYNVSRETFNRLREYYLILSKWNVKINLVAKSTIEQFWQRHIFDSIQLLNYIDDKSIILTDLGSGAGFPGMVLSIVGIKKVILIESNARKAAFLLHASQLSNNKVEIINDRVESLKIKCDIITVRAFANLTKILSYTSQFSIRNKYLILKGKTVQQEIKQALLYKNFIYQLYPSCVEDSSWVLEIKVKE